VEKMQCKEVQNAGEDFFTELLLFKSFQMGDDVIC
jgi:hypothetical protein